MQKVMHAVTNEVYGDKPSPDYRRKMNEHIRFANKIKVIAFDKIVYMTDPVDQHEVISKAQVLLNAHMDFTMD